MGSYVAVAALGAISTGAYALYRGVQSCYKSQNIEDKHLSSFTTAITVLGEALLKDYPKLLEPIESLTMQRYEQIIDFLESEGLPRPQDEIQAFRSSWKAYRENLDSFIDQEYSGVTTFEKAQEAQKEAQALSKLNEQANGRCVYFEHRLTEERLAQGDSTEEGAYAQLLKVGEELSLTRKHYGGMAHSKVKAKIVKHQSAVTTHFRLVRKWRTTQPTTIRKLCVTVQQNLKNTDSFVWEGRAKALKIPENLFKARVSALSHQIQSLKGRMQAIDPALIGESRWGSSSCKIVKLCNWFANFFSRLTTSSHVINDLVSNYKALLKKQEILYEAPKLTPVPEISIPIQTLKTEKKTTPTPTPKETFLKTLQTIPHFRQEMETFIQKNIAIPDDATIKIEGNILTLTLPPSHAAPKGRINPKSSLTPDEFQTLNRNKNQDNLKYLAGKTLPTPKPAPANPKIEDLKYFRSLGPGVTKGLISGAELTSGRTIKMKIKKNTLEFLEGGPKIEGSSSVKITALEFREIDDSLALKEQGIIRVYSKSGWMPLPSDDYFVSDLGRLLPKMQSS